MNNTLRGHRERTSRRVASVAEDPIKFLQQDRGSNSTRLFKSLPHFTLQQLVLSAVPLAQQCMTILDHDYYDDDEDVDEGDEDEDVEEDDFDEEARRHIHRLNK